MIPIKPVFIELECRIHGNQAHRVYFESYDSTTQKVTFMTVCRVCHRESTIHGEPFVIAYTQTVTLKGWLKLIPTDSLNNN